jgi:hypothetical protein
VNELERRLEELGDVIAYPATPDLAGAVATRLEERRRPRRRRALALAFAVLVVAVAGVLAASPGARSAIRDLLEVAGVRVERTDEEQLPVVPTRARPYFGERVSLAEARRRVDFAVRLPEDPALGEPDAVYVRDFPPGGSVTLLYGSLDRPRLALTEWRGTVIGPVHKKLVGPRTTVQRIPVADGSGVWLSGKPHIVEIVGEEHESYTEVVYLAGNVLLWDAGGRGYRIEADIPKARALRIAASLR